MAAWTPFSLSLLVPHRYVVGCLPEESAWSLRRNALPTLQDWDPSVLRQSDNPLRHPSGSPHLGTFKSFISNSWWRYFSHKGTEAGAILSVQVKWGSAVSRFRYNIFPLVTCCKKRLQGSHKMWVMARAWRLVKPLSCTYWVICSWVHKSKSTGFTPRLLFSRFNTKEQAHSSVRGIHFIPRWLLARLAGAIIISFSPSFPALTQGLNINEPCFNASSICFWSSSIFSLPWFVAQQTSSV